MEVQVLSDIRQLMEQAGAWNELLRLNNNQNPYMTLDWIAAWWRYYGHDFRFRFVMLSDGRRVLGFLPFISRRKCGITEYRFLGMPQSSRNGFLVRPGFEKEVVSQAQALFSCISSGALFNLRGLSMTDPCLGLVRMSLSDRRYLVRELPVYYIRLQQDKREAYFQKVRKHYNIRKAANYEKSFASILPLRFLPAAPSEMELIFPLHEKRWTRKNDGNGFGHGTSREFFTYLAREGNPNKDEDPLSFRTGVYLLWAGRLPIGFAYGFFCNGHFAFYRLAHDNDFGLIHPGLMVIKKMIERCYDSAVQHLDFSTGDEEYKQNWTEEHETVCQLLFGTGTLSADLVLTALMWKEKLKSRLKKWKSLVYFKRVTLGRIKYALSKAYWRALAVEVRRALKRHPPTAYIRLAAKKLTQRTGACGQFRLLEIDRKYWHRLNGTGLTIHPARLDQLELLTDLTASRGEDIVRRYKNREQCYLIYRGEGIAAYAWVSGTHVKSLRQTWWKAKNAGDRCIYEPCILESRPDGGKELLCCLASECVGTGKHARVYLLVHRLDREFTRAGEWFQQYGSADGRGEEAADEGLSD